MVGDEHLIEIKALIDLQDYSWFEQKKVICFIHYGFKPHTTKPTVYEEDLIDFCWDSTIASVNDQDIQRLPTSGLTSKGITNDIISIIKKKVKDYTDAEVIDRIIQQCLILVNKNVLLLKHGADNELYHLVLNHFQEKCKDQIAHTFKHIAEQLAIKNKVSEEKRVLTLELCNSIADFKLKNKRLISNLVNNHDRTAGEALLYLLSEAKPDKIKPTLQIWTEGWEVQAVFYLLYKLNAKLADGLVFAEIETKAALYNKKGNRFEANNYYKFVSEKLDGYDPSGKKKKEIDQQLDAII